MDRDAVDLRALLAFHETHRRLATLTTVRVSGRFGVVEASETGRVERFHEKPVQDAWISAGFMVFEQGVFEYLSDDEECILEREPLERLAREKQLMAYRHKGNFFPMDTYRDHVALNELWNTGKAPWKIW